MTFANKSHAGELALKPLLALCAGKADEAEVCAALGKWDGRYDLDSRAAWLFDRFWMKARSVPGIWTVPFDAKDPIQTPRDLVTSGETGDKLIAALDADAGGVFWG